MNLKVHLFSNILLIAIVCLLSSAFYVLHQTDRQAQSEANLTAKLIHKQVTSQLLQMFSRYDMSSTFPNTELWPDINGISGSCIQFLSRSEQRRRTICNENFDSERSWPNWFGKLYQRLFHPDFEVKKNVSFNAMDYGSIVVTLNARIETARAWNTLRSVIGVLFVSIFAVCILVYITINRLLRPAHIIINGLKQMQDGQLETRLPDFDIKEWKHTSDAINALAIAQQQALSENKQLALKLMNIQEEDHRYIARELHDEFGQCLAGINAVTSSINQTAREQCAELVPEIERIQPITHHMMDVLRSMLSRLRPVEIDDLGLKQSLNNLVSNWNNRSNEQTSHQMHIVGNIDQLPEPLPVNIYRIVQECLTNIAKHAKASQSDVIINYFDPSQIEVQISDDGIAELEHFDKTLGVGLLGIRERVMALGGKLMISARHPSGLIINIIIPVSKQADTNND